MDSIRSKAHRILSELESENKAAVQAADDSDSSYRSWIRGSIDSSSSSDDTTFSPSERCNYFDRFGFVKMESFLSNEKKGNYDDAGGEEECEGEKKDDCDCVIISAESMKEYMSFLAENLWEDHLQKKQQEEEDEKENEKEKEKSKITVFRTDSRQEEAQGKSDYFLDSATRIHFFAEQSALDEDGNLKSQYRHGTGNKIEALNKAGHALHIPPTIKDKRRSSEASSNHNNNKPKPNPFYHYTHSKKIKDLVYELGWQNPVVPQSMYIFKQKKIGGVVTSHQDSTFLYTTPKQTCLGLWLALDDATLENGCLWVRPKSHWEPTRRKFVRQTVVDNHSSQSQSVTMQFEDLVPQADMKWDGAIPGCNDTNNTDNIADQINFMVTLMENGFVPIECKAGDLLVFPGELDHLSLANFSDRQRHTFQLHCELPFLLYFTYFYCMKFTSI